MIPQTIGALRKSYSSSNTYYEFNSKILIPISEIKYSIIVTIGIGEEIETPT
ncbi:hypothetical protein KAU92_05405 [Candidatus Bathyarchaeota archaeon]|nr:hypothetical protein [Candidatus Bathyarchaeota archaeon]